MPDINLQKIISELPSDPELGLIQLGDIAQKEISTSGVTERDQLLLASLIVKYANKHSMPISITVQHSNEPSRTYLKRLVQEVDSFRSGVFSRREREQIQIEANSIDDLLNNELPFGEARLTVDEKVSIRSRIKKIKIIIDESHLTERKKNALSGKLNSLLNEVDRDGTSTDGFFAFAADVAMVAREMHDKAKPMIDDVKDILRIVYSRRAKSEGTSLPSPDSFPQLPSNFDGGTSVP